MNSQELIKESEYLDFTEGILLEETIKQYQSEVNRLEKELKEYHEKAK